MSFDVSDILAASRWHSKLIECEPHLILAGENSAPTMPAATSTFIPVDLCDYPYKRSSFELHEAQQTPIDLLSSMSCLPISSPECEDVDHFTWHSQQPSIHVDNTGTTPLYILPGRQLRIKSSSYGANGRAEPQAGSRTPDQERKGTGDKRQAHSIIERRYRDKVNNKLKELYFTLREAKHRLRSRTEASDCVVMSESSTGMKKSDVINDAINYIHESEINFRHMADEIQSLRSQISHFENKDMS